MLEPVALFVSVKDRERPEEQKYQEIKGKLRYKGCEHKEMKDTQEDQRSV